MKAKNLREKTDKELTFEMSKLLKERQDLRFKKVVGVLENPLRLRTFKKDIARIKTILHERELNKLKEQLGKME